MGFRTPELVSLRTAKKFNGYPLVNYATAGTICLADEDGQPRFLLPPSGGIVEVPKRQLKFMSADGYMVTETEFGKPLDLPSSGVVAVITLEAYNDLHTWNANCGSFEQIDLSWMVILGERYADPSRLDSSVCPADRDRIRGYYQGLKITPETKRNRKMLPENFLEERRSKIARFMVPEI